MASGRLRLHPDRAQHRQERHTLPIRVVVGVFTELDIPLPVPFILNAPALPDQAQQGFWRGPEGGEEVLRVGSHGFAVPVSVVSISMIQLVLGQSVRMVSVDSLARRVQVVSRPCPRSECSVSIGKWWP